MNRVERALRQVADALRARDVSFAVVGGLAVSARAEPRFTRDVDLAISVVDDADAERLVHDLARAGYAILATVEQDNAGRLATVRLGSPGSARAGVVVDLLFSSSGIEREVVNAAETMEVVESLFLPIARVGHLIALKLLAQAPRRPQDAADLAALSAVATNEDLGIARTALDQITERGFNRGRDLSRAWTQFVARRSDVQGPE